ncbi:MULTISPECIES: ATP-binding protein [Asticcacaulis]|uniref:sensor histidine kinase n=1 Tax=Asticcacaulis TaxID=76890 RepID=UPI001AE1F438|nr:MULTISPECIES: ATP-binding protein [Asticcacaulis]MBP2158132.1 light-regulated signal transduction histidine kinase (bacteriophytochrome) [Asticcacaulis solisilvae]MDR6799177.1 light-regulated signal transduction histidine kinase (bacteriophytochrome) [Asticcacaulis sp. BE141]
MQETKQVAAQAQTDPAEEFRDFAYIVSHDLAGPVRTILGFSQLLSEDAKKMASEEDRLHLELIQESSQKLNEMIQGLLAFSRLNTVPRAPEMVDLEITLARCHMELQPLIDVTKAQLSYPRMPELVADPRRMFSLFFYLIENAIKFHKPGVAPDIRIFIEERPAEWEFCVSDNGIGIDPMFYDDVFRPLRKLHTDDAFPGVGMGLTLARKIVLQHGGDMHIEASPSGGTAVVFTLAKAGPARS